MNDCLFCMIADGRVPSKKVYEDERVCAFYDINPVAPIHFLVIPKEHIDSADDIKSENSGIVSYIFEVIARLAKELGLKDGYRVVNNCGKLGQQTVMHLHFHVLSGRDMTWPPG